MAKTNDYLQSILTNIAKMQREMPESIMNMEQGSFNAAMASLDSEVDGITEAVLEGDWI
jgi:hypothetical protein